MIVELRQQFEQICGIYDQNDRLRPVCKPESW